MAKREVVWTDLAVEDFLETLEYYFERNGNIKFSDNLNSEVNHVIELISENGFLGKTTDIEGVRVFTKNQFQIFYRLNNSIIQILVVWDTRRDPKKNIKFVK